MNNEKTENRTILLALMNGSENINSCQTLAQVLQEKGHRIVFLIDKTSKQLIESTGFEEEVFGNELDSENSLQLDLNCLNGEPINIVKDFSYHLIEKKFEIIKRYEDFNQELVERIKPDLIIVESTVCSPALTNSGIPWVWLNFGPPNLYRNDHRIPPGWSGIPKQKPNEWKAFINEWNLIFKQTKQDMNDWCTSRGAPELPKNIFHPQSPYLNLYVYPKVLDYKFSNTWELKDWIHFDCLLKTKPMKRFTIPDKLKSRSGKLVYFSMGSFASVEVIKRLTTILAESEHRFIVSKGRFHNQYELPDNMWGLEDIPLIDVIQSVHLVIANGDNKTIFESFSYSKPLIILPLFGDQLDNRTRFKETGFGWGLDPFTCTKETLLCMINSMIDDILLVRRLATMSKSMDGLNAAKQMADEINKILNPKPKPTEEEKIKSQIIWDYPAHNNALVCEAEA